MQLPAHVSPVSLCFPVIRPAALDVCRRSGPFLPWSWIAEATASGTLVPTSDVLSPEAPPASCTELFAELTLPFQLWKDFLATDSDYIFTESGMSSGFDAF